MALTITHTTPADGTFSATGAAAWDATHSFSVTGTSGQIQYNNAGDLSGMSGTAWNDTTRSLALTGATVTASAPVLDLSQTWNNAGVTFTGLKANFTDTASNAASLLLDLQTGGVSRFKIDKNGRIENSTLLQTASFALVAKGTVGGISAFDGSLTNEGARISSAGIFTFLGNPIAFSGSGSGSVDLFLTRRAAANLRFGAGDAAAPVAQTLSVQSVVAGTTNTAGANLTITGSQGTGTGAGGSIIFQVAPAGSSGTAQNALVTALTLTSDLTMTAAGATLFTPLTYTIRPTTDGNGSLNLNARSDSSTTGINISHAAQAVSLFINNSTFPRLRLNLSSLTIQSGMAVSWASGSDPNSVDTILVREAASVTGVRGANSTTGGALGFIEQTAPAAPAANGVRIYAEDDGAGKTRLMARFATGAAQQIAIEP